VIVIVQDGPSARLDLDGCAVGQHPRRDIVWSHTELVIDLFPDERCLRVIRDSEAVSGRTMIIAAELVAERPRAIESGVGSFREVRWHERLTGNGLDSVVISVPNAMLCGPVGLVRLVLSFEPVGFLYRGLRRFGIIVGSLVSVGQ
jgi:hypothetical protein